MEWLDDLIKEYEDKKELKQKKDSEEQKTKETLMKQNRQISSDALNSLFSKLSAVKETMSKKTYFCQVEKHELKSVDTRESFTQGITFSANNTDGSINDPRASGNSWKLFVETNMNFDTFEIKTRKPNGREEPKDQKIGTNIFTQDMMDKLIKNFLKRVFTPPDMS